LAQLDSQLKICFLHIDADLYRSVTDVLDALYERVVDGGVVVIDDFFHHAQGPKRATEDFFNARCELPLYYVSFPYSVFIVKGRHAPVRRHHRAIDGNHYSFNALRTDTALVSAVRSLLVALTDGKAPARALANCRTLLDVLTSRWSHSSDIYRYWQCLEEFWDGMSAAPYLDRATPEREPITM
jgi:O-methyltransferase